MSRSRLTPGWASAWCRLPWSQTANPQFARFCWVESGDKPPLIGCPWEKRHLLMNRGGSWASVTPRSASTLQEVDTLQIWRGSSPAEQRTSDAVGSSAIRLWRGAFSRAPGDPPRALDPDWLAGTSGSINIMDLECTAAVTSGAPRRRQGPLPWPAISRRTLRAATIRQSRFS